MICDTDSRITFWGGGSERLYGWSADEAEGKVAHKLLQTVFPTSLDDILSELYATGRWEGEIIHTTSDGRKINVASTWLLHRNAHGEPLAILEVSTDITEIMLVERALRASEQRYRKLFESNPQPMWVFDSKTLRILEVNEAAVHHYGYTRDEFLAMTIKELRPAEDVELLIENLASHVNDYVASETWRHKKKDGTLIHVELSAHALEFAEHSARLVMAVDVTERYTLEAQLRQSQKMEAVGMLAGGIAHDFNNLLTAINGYAELALRTLNDDNPLARHLREIKRAGGRAAGLTRQLLAFSRKQVMRPKVIDINTVIQNLEPMLRRVISEDIELEADLGPDLGSVRADPGQLEQVIINLVINARDAMPAGGKVGIETANVLFDEEYVRTHLAVKHGPHIKLAISDTGVGMDAATRERVFEPFFTTKEAGKGTGLGLSTVYGIIKQSGGFIWVYSEPGHGTTFKIYLPRVDESSPEADLGDSGERKINGTETILLAEDDDAVRGLARELLEARGYHVLEAENGSAALLHIENHVGAIDMLLTDVIMPEISGSELAERALKIRPELKVLYMSGYTDKSVVHRGVIEPDVNFIQKPFSSNDLTSKVREVLDKETE
jgi:PAS domain S-box-containing protein